MSVANQAQHESWNGDSGLRWAADADRRDEVLAPIADALLAAAELKPREATLDLGCGCGVTTIAAANIVGPAPVVGIDLSAPMLELARQRAAIDTLTFLEADAQTHPFEPGQFDVAISRFGTMFFDDPVAAFTNIATAMRPCGRLCIATWQALAANDWLLVPGAALLRYGHLPETATGSGPGMFAQADPEAVEQVLEEAGWTQIDVTPVRLELCLGRDATEALDYLAGTGVARAVLETIDPAHRDEALDAVEAVLMVNCDSRGVRFGAGINLITAST